MIMQPVNVLPIFVSQETDLKGKESSNPSESRNEELNFSRLVDKHVDDEIKVTTSKEPKVTTESVAANNGKEIAVNGNNDTDEANTRQESDYQKDTSANKNSGNDGETAEVSIKESETNKSNQADSTGTKALDESEQFISLLYDSDQTLTSGDETTKPSEQANQVGSIKNQETNSASNRKIDILDAMAGKPDSIETIDKSSLANDRSNSALLTDHKLKAFSKDELLARAKLKNSNIQMQQSGDQVLKDYQQLLQAKQGSLNHQSITSEQLTNSQLAHGQLTNTQLANIQLEGNKISALAATVSQANKGLLNEQVDNDLSQLPVEPIGKDKLATNDLSLSAKESVINISEKASEKQSEKIALFSAKALADVRPQLAGENSAESINSDTKLTQNLSAIIKNKASNGEGSSNEIKGDNVNSQLGKNILDKVNGDRIAQSAMIGESIVKEQPVDAQTKQPAIMSSQLQALQQTQAHQKEQAVNADLKSVEDAGEEYTESMNLSQGKTQEQGVNSSSKVTDNIATRSISEIQNQAIQANQIKQNNDAYIEHQASEVLNHNVASDTVQIQKNNVQLQQETISIFKKDFADAVKDKVMVMINQKLQQIDIKLDPPEFGNMQVRVNLQGEQAAVNFVVQNLQAKDALEQNMHKLREMLAEQGVDVGGANVEQQNQQQNNDEQNLQEKNGKISRLSSASEQEELSSVQTLSSSLFDSSATGVDYYA